MHFCLFFSFLIFVIATCSFLIWTLLGRKNWWDVMIYIYFRFRRAEEEARLAAQRSEEQQRQAEKRRQLQASNIPTIFSWKNGPPKPFFFWSFLLRKKLNNHGKSYVTFFKSQPTTTPWLFVFQQINESSSSWSVSKSFWISRRWRWRLANLPQRRPFGHVFSLFAYHGIVNVSLRQKKSEKAVRRLKHFWQLKARV